MSCCIFVVALMHQLRTALTVGTIESCDKYMCHPEITISSLQSKLRFKHMKAIMKKIGGGLMKRWEVDVRS